ncbi:MAG: DUF4878 domain-containing protein [Phycisphaeraceae bacterium]|nr:DUF4878 domain-containing protein [Phycisphaeraceae bacterium]
MKHLLTALLLVCSFALVGCGGSAGPGDTVKELNYAMEKGDVETVKKIVPGMAGMVGDEKLKGMLTEAAAEAKKKGNIKSIEILKEEINGDTATVEHKVTWGNGDEDTDTSELAKVDGQWVVSMDDMDKGNGGNINLGGGDDGDADFPDDFEVPTE